MPSSQDPAPSVVQQVEQKTRSAPRSVAPDAGDLRQIELAERRGLEDLEALRVR